MKKTIAIIISTMLTILLGSSVAFAANTVTDTNVTSSTITTTTTTTNTNNVTNTTNTVSSDKNSNVTKVNQEKSTDTDKVVSELVELKNNEKKTLEDYQEWYGSETYGLTAFILNKIQVYSIPFCFIGIALSAIYQYVIGIRKLDVRDKGFGVMISVITVFIIAQVLPLIFAIVVKGWRG